MKKPFLLMFVFLNAIFASVPRLATAQDFPTKPIRIIMHTNPGTATDLATRAVAVGMSRVLNQNVVVENRPGASGLIAYEFVAKQVPADGYTLVTGGSQLATVKLFVKDLRFDPLKDLADVAFFGEGVLIMVANSSLPFNTFNQFVAYAKANPGKINWGTSGFSTVGSLNTYVVADRYGLEITQVPFSSNPIARPELLTNRIQLMWHTVSDWDADSKGGKIKPILVSSGKRLSILPNVPTASELGLPAIVGFYVGLSAPSATPRTAIAKLYGAVASAVDYQDVKETLTKLQLFPLLTTPDETKRKMNDLADVYAKLASQLNIKPQ